MKQIELFDDSPLTEREQSYLGFTDWEIDTADQTILEGEQLRCTEGVRVFWKGTGAIVKKVWKPEARITTDKFEILTVRVEELEPVINTLARPAGNETAFLTENPVGKEEIFKTQNFVLNNLGTPGEASPIGQPADVVNRLRLQGEIKTLEKRAANYQAQIIRKLPPFKTPKTKHKLSQHIKECRQLIAQKQAELGNTVGKETIFKTQNSVGNEIGDNVFPTQNSVGNEIGDNPFPTQNSIGNENLFPTHLWEQIRSKDLSTLISIRELLDREITSREFTMTSNTDDRSLQKDTPPNPYIEAKWFPYKRKDGIVTKRGPYYYLRGYLVPQTYLGKRVPPEYEGLPVYGLEF